MKIFVSVTDRDRARVEDVVLSLQGEGHQVFFYKYSLLPGETFHKQIRDAIGQADIVLFFVTRYSIEPNRYTRTELEIARSKWGHPGNRVLPIELEPVDMGAVPSYLKQVTFCKPQGSVAASVAYEVARLEERLKRKGLLSASSGRNTNPGTRWLEGILAGFCLGALTIVVLMMAEEMERMLGNLQLATLHGLMMAALLWIAAVYFGVRDPFSFLALGAGSVGAFLLGWSVGQLKPPPVASYVIASLTVPAIAALTVPTFRHFQHWGSFALLGLAIGLLVPSLDSKAVVNAVHSCWEALMVGLATYVLSVPSQTAGRTLAPL